MAEEIKIATETQTELEQNYVDTIQQMKQNTVSKAEYEKLKNEHFRLINNVVNGTETDNEPAKVEYRPLDEICLDLLEGNNNNLDYWKKSIEWREANLAAGNPDPWAVSGLKIQAEPGDPEIIERVYEGIKEAIEYANGDPSLFDKEYDRMVVDVNMGRARFR